MENTNIDSAEILKKIMPEEAMNKVYEQQLAEKEAQKIREKEIEVKYSKGFDIEYSGKTVEVFLKKKVTPETRHKLRNIVREYPRHKIRYAIESAKTKYPEKADNASELFKVILADNKDITEQAVLDYVYGIPDENFESELEIFFMKYFQCILSMDKNSTELIENPVVIDGKLNGIWNTIDYDTIIEAVGFFRKKVAI